MTSAAPLHSFARDGADAACYLFCFQKCVQYGVAIAVTASTSPPDEKTQLHESACVWPFRLLFCWSKVGTGFHGTLSGNVYCSSKKILDHIRAFKGMEPAEAEGEDEGEAGRDETATPQARRRPLRVCACDHIIYVVVVPYMLLVLLRARVCVCVLYMCR